VGNLQVLADTDKRKNGYMVWICLCDCGEQILLDTRTLQRGTVQDCGCLTKVNPRQRDLSGQRFGSLTALNPTDDRDLKGTTIWKCRCDCGKETAVSLTQLVRGEKKSCGCLEKTTENRDTQCQLEEANSSSGGKRRAARELQGERFGELTVLEYAGKKNGQNYWHCRCDCGKETTVRENYLLTGKTKSYGCLQAKMATENMKFVGGTSITRLEKAGHRLSAANSSGHNGIYWNRKTQKWVAQIGFKGKTRYLGSYRTIDDAVQARKKAEERIYGEFLEEYYANSK